MQHFSLERRIVSLFALLSLALIAGAFLILDLIGSHNSRAQVASEVVLDERVFLRLLDQDESRLTHDARVIASDYGFRQAIATSDLPTIASTLVNYKMRIDAQLMLLVGIDRRVVADTLETGYAGRPFPLERLIAAAEAKGEASGMGRIDGSLYQLVVVPVQAPERVGWAVIGFVIDGEDTQAFQELAGLQVSYLTRRPGAPYRVAASTLSNDASQALAARLSGDPQVHPSEPFVSQVDGASYETIVTRHRSYGDEDVVTVLQRSRERSIGPFRLLEGQLALYATVGTLIAVLATIVIARSIAKPVRMFAGHVRRIAEGDYTQTIDLQRADEIGDLASAVGQMQTQLQQREQKILQLAYSDPLTGLPNRVLFNDRLAQAIGTAKRHRHALSVIALDLDRFKEVNDSLGHNGGDQLLIEVATRLRTICRRDSDTVARMGGDEFALLLPTEGARDAAILARKVLEGLAAPFTLDGHLVDVGGSFGVATYPEHGTDAVSIMRHADSAMYVAKRSNSGVAIYDPAADHASISRLSLMTELRRAVEGDDLVLFFQPKISLGQPDRLFAEALVRWKHAERGFVPPDEFIPFAEHTGYITTITQTVFRKALRQIRSWREIGIDVHVAVNISTRDLTSPSFTANVTRLLDEYDCPADHITLELTETAILGDPTHSMNTMNALHALGFHLSIDDFGTGYSSLAYLKKLPVRELKIDKSFVMGMTNDSGSAVIVKSTIDLAHNMGLRVVAEGVEDDDSRAALEAMGCDVLQGYLISKPLSADAFAEWVKRVRPPIEQLLIA